jgi:hypothetical protein
VNLVRILNYLSFLAVFAAYALTGYIVSINGRFFLRLIRENLPGRPLPAISELVFYWDVPSCPITIGIVTGLIFAGGLFLLYHNEKTQRWVPLGLTIAWGLCVLHLLAFVCAVGLASVPQRFEKLEKVPSTSPE